MTTESKPTTTAGTNKRPRKKKPTPEERYLKIQEQAYYLAEKDGFKKDSVEYWLAAEAAEAPAKA